MQAPKLPANFSLFKQRPTRTFDYTPRYYDARKEEREQRMAKAKEGVHDREALRERMRHSWQREGGHRASTTRLVVIMGLVCAVLYFIIKGFGLLEPGAWPI